MNKYGIEGEGYHEDDPGHKKEKLVGQTVPKVERAVSGTQSLDEGTLGKVDKIIEKAREKYGIELNRDELLLKSLEAIAERDGGLQERHQEDYEGLLSHDIANEIGDRKDEMYEVLRERLGNLKGKGIDVDDKKVEGQVIEIIDERKGEDR